ncbi:hypothetical protein HDF12_002757 [Edaphobacter lichenicola]|uniref:DUF5675 domain-containing protein n=2 Tax=Tunturiibacter TaxID=3154218 RepID=A0A7Y9NP31_9BACT|nr:hypothetical protein [Edaphobacter lichenicola]
MHWSLSALYCLIAVSTAIGQGTCPAKIPNEFKIDLVRLGTDEVIDRGVKVKRVYGDIGINNQNFGRFYENPMVMIPEGSYTGNLRYQSNHNFVLSRCGVATREGDFLIEVNGVKDAGGKTRADILFHPGALPSNSQGCVLFGARKKDPDGGLLPLDSDYPLVKVRQAFYGTDDPKECPNKVITITVKGSH